MAEEESSGNKIGSVKSLLARHRKDVAEQSERKNLQETFSDISAAADEQGGGSQVDLGMQPSRIDEDEIVEVAPPPPLPIKRILVILLILLSGILLLWGIYTFYSYNQSRYLDSIIDQTPPENALGAVSSSVFQTKNLLPYYRTIFFRAQFIGQPRTPQAVALYCKQLFKDNEFNKVFEGMLLPRTVENRERFFDIGKILVRYKSTASYGRWFLSRYHWDKGEMKKASEELWQSFVEAGQDPSLLILIASLAIEQEQVKVATAALSRATTIWSANRLEILVLLSRLNELKGSFGEAVLRVERANLLYPGHQFILLTLSRMYEQVQETSKALRILEEYHQHNPVNKLATRRYVHLLFADKQPDKALGYMRRLIRAFPIDSTLLEEMGDCYLFYLRQPKVSLPVYLKSKKYRKNESPELDFKLAVANYNLGRFSEAATQWQALVQRGYNGADLLYNLGTVRVRLGQAKKGLLSFRRIKNPQIDGYNNMGVASTVLGRNKDALKYYWFALEQATRMKSKEPFVRRNFEVALHNESTEIQSRLFPVRSGEIPKFLQKVVESSALPLQ